MELVGCAETCSRVVKVSRSGCLNNATLLSAVSTWTEVETTISFASPTTTTGSASGDETGDGSLIINWTKAATDGSSSGSTTKSMRCWASTISESPSYGSGNAIERVCMVGASVVGTGKTTGTTGNGYGAGATVGGSLSKAAQDAVWVPRNVLSSANVAPYGVLGGAVAQTSIKRSPPPDEPSIPTGAQQGISAATATLRACGCGTQTVGSSIAVDWPWHVCRSNTNGACHVVSGTSGECDNVDDFNCGTMYGWNNDATIGGGTTMTGSFLSSQILDSTNFLHLCSGCNPVPGDPTRLTVGQCKDEFGNCAGKKAS